MGSDEQAIARVRSDPRYAALVRRRSRLGWALAALMVAAFLGYILLIAFDKALLAAPIGAGVTSVGIPVGFGLILLAVALTGLYVARANGRYDAELAAILADARA
ncbi:DUF485 domain-containing protein [Sphingomonas naphthae]|uniref:DUF485 domain-containing protein n=1 Tax=Sphingomonas naphthae TaxID=1813468 RepID=A0ABY7TM79_9SPHN|nr:DUF485 domain-containing protein [Sphingomonas naphthae]WCT74332.1 DUF485 domain-containing protein [Sphingomonas naphthae]